MSQSLSYSPEVLQHMLRFIGTWSIMPSRRTGITGMDLFTFQLGILFVQVHNRWRQVPCGSRETLDLCDTSIFGALEFFCMCIYYRVRTYINQISSYCTQDRVWVPRNICISGRVIASHMRDTGLQSVPGPGPRIRSTRKYWIVGR
jgi:hypothetical protein